MNKINNYDSYVNQYRSYDASAQGGAQRTAAGKAGEAVGAKPVELSSGAKNLLKELQQKYGNMDFIVGDYETDEEAAAYLARGTKEYSVLISADELEKMAKDESSKKEGMDRIEQARNELAYAKTQLEASGENVKNLGVVFEKDGTSTLFASLEKSGEQLSERMAQAREEKRSKARDAEKADAKKSEAKKSDARDAKKAEAANSLYSRTKQTTVKAKTVEDLLEEIRNVDWNSVEEKLVPASGSRFDYFG